MRWLFAVVATVSVVHAEPCPPFGLRSEVILPSAEVSSDGGIVVGELPAMDANGGTGKPPSPDRSGWKLRADGKAAAAKADVIAPGLVVYRPPAGAKTFELLDGSTKPAGKAKLVVTAPALLDAPRVKTVISGQTRDKHVSTFVNVVLDGKAPKGAIALVVAEAKGAPRSWGRVFEQLDTITVYSTSGGCVTLFPDGTVISQPGDRVVAFWVDATGRRSPTTPPLIVAKAP
ncbi:MAG: hypothetical protein ABI867_32195 [Kofleriaceae bacterium]